MTINTIFRRTARRLIYRPHAGHIGVGLVGIGGWGWTNACNIMKSGQFYVKGIYDKAQEATNNFTSTFRVKAYKSFEAMLEDDDIQVVAISTPNHTHYNLVMQACDAGKHIFVEKPLTSNADECRYLGRYCDSKNVVLMVGHHLRREPALQFIKEMFINNKLGTILFARGVRTIHAKQEDWRQSPDLCPGGAMEQLGIHIIDFYNDLFGCAQTAEGSLSFGESESGQCGHANLFLEYPYNIRASVDASFSSPNYFNISLFGTKASAVTDGMYVWISDGYSSKRFRPKGIKGGIAQFRELADCIENNIDSQTNAATSANAIESINKLTRKK